MKIFLVGCISLITLIYCGKNSKEQKSTNTTITSITYEEEDIRGNYYGKKYRFKIHVNDATDIDILSFCRTNFPDIFANRVNETEITNAILAQINNDNSNSVNVSASPLGLSLTAEADFDDYPMSVSLDIYKAKDNNLLAMSLKYYFPL